MRKLMNGERHASLLQVILAVALVLGSLGLLLFLWEALTVANHAVKSEKELRQIIQTRCQQRLAYDQRFVAKAKADADTWGSLYASSLKTVIPPGTPQHAIDQFHEQQRIILEAKQNADKIVAEGVIGNCAVFQTDKNP